MYLEWKYLGIKMEVEWKQSGSRVEVDFTVEGSGPYKPPYSMFIV